MDNQEKYIKIAEILGIDLDNYGLDEDDMLKRYDEYIDDVTEEIEVMGCTCKPSKFLKDNDEIAYRTGFSDWTDSEERDGRYTYFNSRWYEKDHLEEIKDEMTSEIENLFE